jgi:hypothetical protein
MIVVAEGTGAIRAYEAMVYGVEKDDPVEAAAAAILQIGFTCDVLRLAALEPIGWHTVSDT